VFPATHRLPRPLLTPPPERAERDAFAAQQLICGSEDAGFLRYLAASYRSRGKHQPALQCLERLTVLAPGACCVGRAVLCVLRPPDTTCQLTSLPPTLAAALHALHHR
jgi:hypothetical protein